MNLNRKSDWNVSSSASTGREMQYFSDENNISTHSNYEILWNTTSDLRIRTFTLNRHSHTFNAKI